MSAIDIVGLDHVVLRCRDVRASRRFYCEVLGCREERVIEDLGLYQLRCGSSLIDLVDLASPLGKAGGAGPGSDARNMDHFAVTLANFDEEKIRAHLALYGVEPGEVSERYGARGNGPSMYIRDPDDNVVELKGVASSP